mgnify:CR=1 FL=1
MCFYFGIPVAAFRNRQLLKHPITDEGSAEKQSLTFYIGLSAVRHLNFAQVIYCCTMRYWHMQSRRLICGVCHSIRSHIALSQWLDGVIMVAQAARKLLNKVKTEFVNPVNVLSLLCCSLYSTPSNTMRR